LVIYGMTGDFEDGEGVGLTTRLGINQTISFPERDFYEIKTTEDVVTRSNFVHAITDFDIEQPSYFRNKDFQAIKTMLPTTIMVRIDVSGTFSGDEGVDCELYCKFD